MAKFIKPLEDLGDLLLSVEKPARYLGGEYGSISRDSKEDELHIALSFPDLYEIGMSNSAIRIIYNFLNMMPGVRCERVFAPAPDFENVLRNKGIPLYTLESGMPLCEVDLLCFSFGYELAASSMLSILESGQIPIDAVDRKKDSPLVILGGPAISNPHPFSRFIDAAYIGEAEESFFPLIGELAHMKHEGASRVDFLSRICLEKSMWVPRRDIASYVKDDLREKHSVKAIYFGFSSTFYNVSKPIPVVKAVQDHGTVEIMRGCPNGCRFCHAGYFYRPQRMKSFDIILKEVENLVLEGGFHRISLTSLSSGDYSGIDKLLNTLNSKWAGKGISFQLPSLKVNTFSLPIIESLSEVRKSGLTFALETPVDSWQLILNKTVSFDHTVRILDEARKRGFRQAKFYFMIGLPVPERGHGEVVAIVELIKRLLARVPIQINMTVGVFVPKPHTPFQWCEQLSEDDSIKSFNFLRSELKHFRNVKISFHSPFVSIFEGIISRGDERVGELIFQGFKRGARLDAWEEHFDEKLWRSVIEEANWNVLPSVLRSRKINEDLPWDDISVGVSKAFLMEEYKKAERQELTTACDIYCKHPCGSCSEEAHIVENNIPAEVGLALLQHVSPPIKARILFSITKSGVAIYYNHLGIIEAFERAFMMLQLPIAFSEGFNPLPRLELIQPLPMGVSSKNDLASLLITASEEELFQLFGSIENLIDLINSRLPEGIRIEKAGVFQQKPQSKIYSLGGLSWGFIYSIRLKSSIKIGDLDIFDVECLVPSLVTSMEAANIKSASITVDISEEESKKTIILCLPVPQKKEQNLFRLLEVSFHIQDILIFFEIGRIGCLASTDVSRPPKGYFEMFEELSASK